MGGQLEVRFLERQGRRRQNENLNYLLILVFIHMSVKTVEEYLPSSVCESLALLPTCPQEVLSIAKFLKETHSSGVDDLNPRVIVAAR